jgi:hypothetical protein
VLLHKAEALERLEDVADEAAAALGKVLGLHAAALVESAILDAQLAHTQALADVQLAQQGRCKRGWVGG